MQRRPPIAKLLRVVADIVEAGSPSEIEAATKALLMSRPKSRRKTVKGNTDGVARERWRRMLTALRHARSREAAADLIAGERLTRRDLEEVARVLEIHVSREDKSDVLAAKIVETTIGSRLSSEAIRDVSRQQYTGDEQEDGPQR